MGYFVLALVLCLVPFLVYYYWKGKVEEEKERKLQEMTRNVILANEYEKRRKSQSSPEPNGYNVRVNPICTTPKLGETQIKKNIDAETKKQSVVIGADETMKKVARFYAYSELVSKILLCYMVSLSEEDFSEIYSSDDPMKKLSEYLPKGIPSVDKYCENFYKFIDFALSEISYPEVRASILLDGIDEKYLPTICKAKITEEYNMQNEQIPENLSYMKGTFNYASVCIDFLIDYAMELGDEVLLNGLSNFTISRGLLDEERLKERTKGFQPNPILNQIDSDDSDIDL